LRSKGGAIVDGRAGRQRAAQPSASQFAPESRNARRAPFRELQRTHLLLQLSFAAVTVFVALNRDVIAGRATRWRSLNGGTWKVR